MRRSHCLLSESHSRFRLSCRWGCCIGLLLSMTGLACCKAVTSFLFSFSRVCLSVKGFKKGTGAFDLTMPSGRTGFLGMIPAGCESSSSVAKLSTLFKTVTSSVWPLETLCRQAKRASKGNRAPCNLRFNILPTCRTQRDIGLGLPLHPLINACTALYRQSQSVHHKHIHDVWPRQVRSLCIKPAPRAGCWRC